MSVNSSFRKLIPVTMSEFIEREMLRAQEDVRKLLPPIENLSIEECKRIIRRYTVAVSGHFTIWVSAAAIACRSVEGRYAATENAYLEIRDDHPGMLRQFAKLSEADPERSDYADIDGLLSEVQVEVSKMSGLFLTAYVGMLENTSAEFIPWLAKMSKRLGNTNLYYADIHGVADIEHATQFKWALEKEAAHYDKPEEEIRRSIRIGLAFLRGILKPQNDR